MRILKDETKYEEIVKCPNCNSIFVYGKNDIETTNNNPLPIIQCPCCKNNAYCYEYIDMSKKVLGE